MSSVPSTHQGLCLDPQILSTLCRLSHLKMDSRKRLAYAIIQFLQDQLRHGGLSSDAQESLEGRHTSPCLNHGVSSVPR